VVVRFYNKRGTAEQWIKEGKQAVKMTRLSCHRFRSNEVRLWLSMIAYNLGNLWRWLVLPKKIENWSLTSLQQRLLKTGGRLIKHARYYWLLLAESHLTRRLFASMVCRIAGLPCRPDRGGGEINRGKEEVGRRGVGAIARKQGSFSSSRGWKSPGLHAWKVTGVARDGQDQTTAPTEAIGSIVEGSREAKRKSW